MSFNHCDDRQHNCGNQSNPGSQQRQQNNRQQSTGNNRSGKQDGSR